MWQSTLPDEPPIQPGWWVEWQYHRTVARGRAAMEAREQEKRSAEIRRTVQRTKEAICLLEAAPPAWRGEGVSRAARHLRRGEVESRSVRPAQAEPFVGVQVDPAWRAYLDEAKYSRTNRVR